MLGVDYAWTHPNPAGIKADGYDIVLRYISDDPSKDLYASEASQLLAAHLGIAIVFETTSSEALAGVAAGQRDAKQTEARANAIGYPLWCPLYYAVDSDCDPSAITPYFQGIRSVAKRPVGVYGSYRVVEAMIKLGLARYGWQTMAWSYDRATQRYLVSNLAHYLQRVSHTRPSIGGVQDNAWDENAVLAVSPYWGTLAPQPPVKPPVTPPVRPTPPVPPITLVEDGILGTGTIARWQHVMGSPVDGKISTPKSTLVYQVQVLLDSAVHSGLALDGYGIFQDDKPYKTVYALQQYLHTGTDGIMSTPTSTVVKAIQHRLNAGAGKF